MAPFQAQEVPPTPRKALLGAGGRRGKCPCKTLPPPLELTLGYCRLLSIPAGIPARGTTAPRRPRAGRAWQAAPSFRVAVRGCDLTSLACSKVGLLALDAPWTGGQRPGLGGLAQATAGRRAGLGEAAGGHTPGPRSQVTAEEMPRPGRVGERGCPSSVAQPLDK